MSDPYDRISEEEYLVREPQAEYKSEFRQGKVYAMSGASPNHELIAGNMFAELHRQLKGRPCKAFLSNLRVKVAAAHFYTYPDTSVVCEPPRFDAKDPYALVNPTLLVEVLSPSTADYDRGEKFEYYKKLASLREYVLISQDRVSVAVHTKGAAGWVSAEYTDLTGVVPLDSIDCRVPVREIYDKVDL